MALRSAGGRLDRRQLQGDPARRPADRPAGRDPRRCLPGPGLPRPGLRLRRRHGGRHGAPAAGERHGQLREGRAAAAGADRPGRRQSPRRPALRRPVGRAASSRSASRPTGPFAGQKLRRPVQAARGATAPSRRRDRRHEPAVEATGPAADRAVNPWLIALTVTIATFMEVLDTSIANVALPHIAGDLGASLDDANWVLTSYLVANAMIIPLSSWLSTALGRKRYYMGCVAIFTLTSALCGLATSLPMLIALADRPGDRRRRPPAGLAGHPARHLPRRAPGRRHGRLRRGRPDRAGARARPSAAGSPTTTPGDGSFISTSPPACSRSLLNALLVEDPEYLKADRAAILRRGLRIDYVGIGLIALGLGCLEVVLDKGQEWDWFGSHAIIVLTDPHGRRPGRRPGLGAAPSRAVHQPAAPARPELPGRLHHHLLHLCRALRQHPALAPDDAGADGLRRDQRGPGPLAGRALLDDHDDRSAP